MIMRQPKMKGGVKECDNRTLRSDEIDSVVLKEVLKLVFSRHNLEKYSEMIADSVIDEKKELEALVSRYRKEKKAFLYSFIKSVTVHPDKLTVEYHPPYFTNKKSPSLEGEGFSVIRMASPTGFEPVLPT